MPYDQMLEKQYILWWTIRSKCDLICFFLWALLIFWIYFIGKRICFVFFDIFFCFSSSLHLQWKHFDGCCCIHVFFFIIIDKFVPFESSEPNKNHWWLFKRSPIGACILWLNHLTFPSYASNYKSLWADRFKCRFYCVCLVPISIWHLASNANENQQKKFIWNESGTAMIFI